MLSSRLDFGGWFREAHPRLGTSLAFAFGDTDLAQDAADEALTRAFERWDRVSTMESPSGWVCRVAFNVARRTLRRRRIESGLLGRRVDHVEPPAGELWELVSQLPDRQRQAVVLRHVAALTEREIGDAMGITRGSVSSTLRTAYRSLRTELADDGSTP
ncbi:MAG: hypothetical protein GY708_19645 [Actinomycetia bacterium]|nr:hypothetical protein [Actinomycetes bacterium]